MANKIIENPEVKIRPINPLKQIEVARTTPTVTFDIATILEQIAETEAIIAETSFTQIEEEIAMTQAEAMLHNHRGNSLTFERRRINPLTRLFFLLMLLLVISPTIMGCVSASEEELTTNVGKTEETIANNTRKEVVSPIKLPTKEPNKLTEKERGLGTNTSWAKADLVTVTNENNIPLVDPDDHLDSIETKDTKLITETNVFTNPPKLDTEPIPPSSTKTDNPGKIDSDHKTVTREDQNHIDTLQKDIEQKSYEIGTIREQLATFNVSVEFKLNKNNILSVDIFNADGELIGRWNPINYHQQDHSLSCEEAVMADVLHNLLLALTGNNKFTTNQIEAQIIRVVPVGGYGEDPNKKFIGNIDGGQSRDPETESWGYGSYPGALVNPALETWKTLTNNDPDTRITIETKTFETQEEELKYIRNQILQGNTPLVWGIHDPNTSGFVEKNEFKYYFGEHAIAVIGYIKTDNGYIYIINDPYYGLYLKRDVPINQMGQFEFQTFVPKPITSQ